MNTSQTTPAPADASTPRHCAAGIEERDAATLLGLYAEDAELHVVDRNDQPSHPKIIRGRAAIGEYFADVCGRDMTHPSSAWSSATTTPRSSRPAATRAARACGASPCSTSRTA